MGNPHPSKEECFRLFEQYHTPPHVIQHCVAVSEAALKMAAALNQKGYCLDLDLVQGAALLHDILRIEDEHWKKGGQVAADLGYTEEAAIIQVHMRYSPFSSVESVKEMDLVCLADRMVEEHAYVGLEKRMADIIERAKANGHLDAEARILEKEKEAQGLIDGIEQVLGITIDQLMAEKGKTHGNG